MRYLARMSSYWKAVNLMAFLFTRASGLLQQLPSTETACLGDTTIFVCFNERGSHESWTVSNQNRPLSFAFNLHSNISHIVEENIATSSLRAEIIFRNSTFIQVMLTVIGVWELDPFSVGCNEHLVSWEPWPESKIPSSLYVYDIQNQGVLHNYSINIEALNSSERGEKYYFVLVTPAPTNESSDWATGNNWATTGSVFRLMFQSDTYYNISIATCPYRRYTTYFGLNVCVHSSPFISNVTYHISSNGSTAILVTCMNGDIIRRECDKESFYQDICLPGTTFGNVRSTFFRKQYNMTDEAMETIVGTSITNSGSLVVSLLVGGISLLLLFLIIITFVLGVLCGVRVCGKKSPRQDSRNPYNLRKPRNQGESDRFNSGYIEETDYNADNKVYEEVVDLREHMEVRFSQNVAYGENKTCRTVNII